MADSTLTGAIRKAFLAGVGALSLAGEKVSQVVDDLAERGATAVSQGRDLNQELTRKVTDATSGARDELLRARVQLMSAQERAEFAAAVQRVTAQVDAQQAAREAARRHEDAAGTHVGVDFGPDEGTPSPAEVACPDDASDPDCPSHDR